MASDLVSKRLRSLLEDYFAGTSLRIISNEFDAEDVPYRGPNEIPHGAMRRTMVQGYYDGLDFSSPQDARKFLKVLEAVLSGMDDAARSPFEQQLKRDGYKYTDGQISPVANVTRLASTKGALARLDAAHIMTEIGRIEHAIDTDPALAIGTAKELLESVCKTILRERGKPVAPNDDLPQLAKATFKALKLVPDAVPDAAKGAKTIKVMLSNLATVTQGIAELRNFYGTGHGRDGQTKGLGSRHAKLAVGAAGTLATFLVETHLDSNR